MSKDQKPNPATNPGTPTAAPPKTERQPRERKELPAEIRAMVNLERAMNELDPDEANRVLSWAMNKYGPKLKTLMGGEGIPKFEGSSSGPRLAQEGP